MATALGILITHRYGAMGGAPAICLGADGHPTDCRWKASRRRGANGQGIQHLEHLADLIDQEYAADRATRSENTAIRDHLLDELALIKAMPARDDFQRGRAHAVRELAEILNVEGVQL